MRSSYKALLGGLSLLATHVQVARSHAVIVAVAGDNGVAGAGFGMGKYMRAVMLYFGVLRAYDV